MNISKIWNCKSQTIRTRAWKGLILFGIWMILLTLLSRAASNMTIPQVETAEAGSGELKYKITAPGQIKENQVCAVVTVPGIRIDQILIREGDAVKKGDSLFALDQEDLKEQILYKRQEIEKADLSIRDIEGRKAAEQLEKKTAQRRAQEDYDQAAQAGDTAIWRAYNAMMQAKDRLSAFEQSQNTQGTEETDLVQESLELQYQEKKKKKEEAAERLSQAQKDKEAEAELKKAEQELKKAEQELNEADAARAQYQIQKETRKNQGESQERLALEETCRQTEAAYQDALREKERNMAAASRQMEDAGKALSSDSSGKMAALDRKILEKELKKLEKLSADGGIVRSEAEGVVLEISIQTGNDTVDGGNVIIADASTGSTFQAQIPKEQQQYMKKGEEAVLETAGGAEIKGLTLDSIRENREDSQMLDVTVKIPDSSLEIGSTAELKIERSSRNYSCIIPIGALRSEEQRFFVLVPEMKETVLGSELVASRVYVEVAEKNDTMAAISDGSISSGQAVIISSEKTIKEGDRICQKEKSMEME